jgi:hypothetical protein
MLSAFPFCFFCCLLSESTAFYRRSERPLNLSLNTKVVQNILASIAAVFGVVTIVAGTRVLLGADPGYIVFQPLLIYNTAMGVAYIGAGLLAWRNARQGQFAAAAIFILNGFVLAAIAYLYLSQEPVAVDSLRAMILRTVVWSVLLLGLVWVARRSTRKDAPV